MDEYLVVVFEFLYDEVFVVEQVGYDFVLELYVDLYVVCVGQEVVFLVDQMVVMLVQFYGQYGVGVGCGEGNFGFVLVGVCVECGEQVFVGQYVFVG